MWYYRAVEKFPRVSSHLSCLVKFKNNFGLFSCTSVNMLLLEAQCAPKMVYFHSGLDWLKCETTNGPLKALKIERKKSCRSSGKMDRGQMWSHKDVTCFIHIWSKHISILVKKIVLYKKCTPLQPAFVLVKTLVVFPPAAGSFYWIMTWMTGNVHRHLPCRLNLLRFQTLQVHFAARISFIQKVISH